MNALLFNGGVVAGLIGLLLMSVAVAARLAGHFVFSGFATGTMMLAGIGAISAGCFLLLWAVADQARKQR